MTGLRSDHGAVAVEFALVLPILIVLLLGIIEFGLAYNAQITITAAAREGARTMAIQNSPTVAKAAAKAAAPAANPAITDSQITIGTIPVSTPVTCTPGATTTVTISYPYKFLSGMFGAGYTMTGKAAMRCGG